jgi:hypothetical protein
MKDMATLPGASLPVASGRLVATHMKKLCKLTPRSTLTYARSACAGHRDALGGNYAKSNPNATLFEPREASEPYTWAMGQCLEGHPAFP